MFSPKFAVLFFSLLRLYEASAQSGCTNQCPPINFGTPVPSLCENDLAEDFADIDREYESCHPSAGDTFRFRDFTGEGKVTVISNFYIGCNGKCLASLPLVSFSFANSMLSLCDFQLAGERQASMSTWLSVTMTCTVTGPTLLPV